MTHGILLRTVGRLASELLLVAGLALSVGVAGTGADVPGAPLLQSVQATSDTTLHIVWESRTSRERGFMIEVRRGDALVPPLHDAPPLGGRGSIGSATVVDLQPDTRYCVRVAAAVDAPRSGLDPTVTSEERCATTLPSP